MRRISYWLLSTLSAVVLLVGFDASQHGGTLTATPPSSFVSSGKSQATTSGGSGGSNGGSNSSSGSSRSGSTSSSGSKSSSPANPSGSSGSAPSTVTGATVQTMYGPVQIQLVVKGSNISNVRVLQYPRSMAYDIQLDNYALPILIRETVQQQSAHIDMVSGATYTSTGYIKSLQSALDQANL